MLSQLFWISAAASYSMREWNDITEDFATHLERLSVANISVEDQNILDIVCCELCFRGGFVSDNTNYSVSSIASKFFDESILHSEWCQ